VAIKKNIPILYDLVRIGAFHLISMPYSDAMKEKHEKWMAKVRESTAIMNDKVHEQQNLPEITWDPLIILLRQQNSELCQKNQKPSDHFFVRENLHEKKIRI